MAVDHCACRDKHCGQKNEDSAAAKIHTNKLLDKAFYKAQCPSFEHQLCERSVNCGFDHDVASNARYLLEKYLSAFELVICISLFRLPSVLAMNNLRRICFFHKIKKTDRRYGLRQCQYPVR